MIKAENMRGLLNLLTLMVHISEEDSKYCDNRCAFITVTSEGLFSCGLFGEDVETDNRFLCLRCRDCLTYFE